VIASDPACRAESGNLLPLAPADSRPAAAKLDRNGPATSNTVPTFPRVWEIRRLLQDLDQQKQAETQGRSSQLLEDGCRPRATGAHNLDELTPRLKANEAATQYAAMREEANAVMTLRASTERWRKRVWPPESRNPKYSVVDYARQPDKPVSPDLRLYGYYLVCRPFAGDGGAFLMESILPPLIPRRTLLFWRCLPLSWLWAAGHAQAPTPSTSGLPTGVVRLPHHSSRRTCPMRWSRPRCGMTQARLGCRLRDGQPVRVSHARTDCSGDFLDVSEVTRRSSFAVRVSRRTVHAAHDP